jgi:hypothetical protein
VADPAELWARYARVLKTRYPVVGNAGLHVIVPVALLAVAIFVGAGLARPVTREQVSASSLVPRSVQFRFLELERASQPLKGDTHDKLPESRQSAADRAMRRLMAAAKLEDCRRDDVEYTCAGPQLKDIAIPIMYVGGLLVMAMLLLLWLIMAYEESWVAPRWSRRLWRTPAYVMTVVLITCGPLLMREVYYRRANAGHTLPAAAPTAPSALLYVLLVLQVSTLVVAFIRSRPSYEAIVAWSRGPLLAVAAIAAVSGLLTFKFTPGVVALLGAIALVGFVVMPLQAHRSQARPRRGRAHRPPQVFKLSAFLLVAWSAFAIDMILDPGGVIDQVLVALCLALAVVHVMASRLLELDPKTHVVEATPRAA